MMFQRVRDEGLVGSNGPGILFMRPGNPYLEVEETAADQNECLEYDWG